MLGHVAQSVGGALPGKGLDVFVAQFLFQQSAASPSESTRIVPDDGYAFLEAVGRGGRGSYQSANSNYNAGGGAAGNDTIVPVKSGQSIKAVFADRYSTDPIFTFSLDGAPILTANSGGDAISTAAGLGGAGKYPGTGGLRSGTFANAKPGVGGGRLAGVASALLGNTAIVFPGGAGSGAYSSLTSAPSDCCGGISMGMATIFRSYDAALAFANSLYNGAWQP